MGLRFIILVVRYRDKGWALVRRSHCALGRCLRTQPGPNRRNTLPLFPSDPRFKAQVEWPGNTPPVPPPCEACGAARVFEMQLMSPVLAALDEMQEWGLGRGRAPPASWAWLTVAVFTCGAGCNLENAPGRATKEWLAVALE